MKLRTSHYLIIAFLAAFTYFYSKDGLVATSVLYTAIQFALPLALAAMVGVMCERTGVVNIGIEGTMLISAFTAFFAGAILKNTVQGMLVGVFTGAMMGLLLALMAVNWKMDQIIAGTIINILAKIYVSKITETFDTIILVISGIFISNFHPPSVIWGGAGMVLFVLILSILNPILIKDLFNHLKIPLLSLLVGIGTGSWKIFATIAHRNEIQQVSLEKYYKTEFGLRNFSEWFTNPYVLWNFRRII
jgi:ABC-type uncharacterized transport system permease subunit